MKTEEYIAKVMPGGHLFIPEKDETFSEVARPFRDMAKKEKLKPEDVAEEITKYRKKG